MYYKIQNGSVSFGADTVLENIDIEIKEKEKIAIVGRNGCGKSTLLKAIIGEVLLEEGTGEETFSVSKSGGVNIGYLKQIAFEDEDVKMLDEILKVFKPLFNLEEKMATLLTKIEQTADEKTIKSYSYLCDLYELSGGYTYKKEYNAMIKSFGFTEEDKQKRLSEFSGGQRTKIAFIKLLLSKPDILLLDEPTNHLDLTTIEWLEDYLKNYKSAVVIVSHDRMFLNRIVGKVYEIEYGETRCYKGNYSDFERQKRENFQKQLKDHELQRAEISRLNKLIERFRYKPTKAKMVQSKIKMVERMKIIDAPNRYDLKTFHASFQPEIANNKIALKVENLIVGYDKPLASVNFELLNGQKLGIIGSNGIGKSTFCKTLVKQIEVIEGSFSFGSKSQIGYFDQQMALVSSDQTVFEYFHDKFPKLNETQIRSALGAFMFTGEDVFKNIKSLSGGERVRLALCTILKKKPNVLILDEPTNHMDIVGKETLENMLKEYLGTLIVVSHDRYFIEKVADKLLVFDKDKTTFYPYGYFEYSEKLKCEQNKEEEKTQQKTTKKEFYTPLKDRSKKQKRVQKLESLINEIENKLSEIEKDLSNPLIYSDYIKVSALQEESEKLKTTLNEYMDEWTILMEELEG